MFEKTIDENKISLIEKIIGVADVDTVFRDIYIEHARDLLSDTLAPDDYQDIIREKNMLTRLPNLINEAMDKNDWKTVQELSVRMKNLHRWTESNQYLFDIGREVYSANDIYLNPFSPGMYHEAGVKIDEIPTIRKDIIKKLDDIISSDESMHDFYTTRKNYFSSLQVNNTGDDKSPNEEIDLEEQAKLALEHGDLNRLEELSENILKRNKEASDSLTPGKLSAESVGETNSERLFNFSKETLEKAGKLGLNLFRIDPSPEYAALFRHALKREFKADKTMAWEKIIEADPLFKKGIPEPLRNLTEIFSKHLIMNSLGTRYFPDYVTEDVLLENFPEEQVEDESDSLLLKMLGLKSRKGLSRLDIERSLSVNGCKIIKDELGLDPVIFKLICIPPDIYIRLGESMGWGSHELWTHFDGYSILQNNMFTAIAGGDKRFGGIFDLVTIGREYESDHVIARFAVVQRTRMLKMI